MTHLHPKGTTFGYSAAGSVYTDMPDLISVAPPKLERGHSDDTLLASFGEITTPGWIKATDSDFKLYLTKALYVILTNLWAAGTTYYWKITYPLIDSESAASTWVWTGYVASIETSEAEKLSDEKINCTLSIRRVTAPVFTAGS